MESGFSIRVASSCAIIAFLGAAFTALPASTHMRQQYAELDPLIDSLNSLDAEGRVCIAKRPTYYTPPTAVAEIDEFQNCIESLEDARQAEATKKTLDNAGGRSIAAEYLRTFSTGDLNKAVVAKYGAAHLPDLEIADECRRYSVLAHQIIVQRSRAFRENKKAELGALFYQSAMYTCSSTVFEEFYRQRICRKRAEYLSDPAIYGAKAPFGFAHADGFVCENML
ncbi:hypothetical protein QO010_000225 [Caulobacter ginsengisoli]|uniref:DUF1311 domain-containing protein n=1 Tax=Caulobacter ginsengisoli TaxID=400775 RepID=A0ABU0IKD5_9CAUL|nr:hypothetical protein [Caulobacter ginsengisoli]MDQ0462477.1 hypothetical protein [Caulobacter ginsengisoli]